MDLYIKTINFLFYNYIFNSSQKWLNILLQISYFHCWSIWWTDHNMSFFASYPLSARGHDIWMREFKKNELFKFSFNFNVVFCKVFIFKYLFAISLEKGVQILQFCIFEMCINFIFFYPILIVFLLLLNGLCWELSVVCPWIF